MAAPRSGASGHWPRLAALAGPQAVGSLPAAASMNESTVYARMNPNALVIPVAHTRPCLSVATLQVSEMPGLSGAQASGLEGLQGSAGLSFSAGAQRSKAAGLEMS